MGFDCARAFEMLERGAARPCPANECGPRLQTVTAYGRGGRALGSASRVVLPGQAGWDGSLDGRYRRREIYNEHEPRIIFGGTIFQRVAGGGGDLFRGFASSFAPSSDPQKTAQSGKAPLTDSQRAYFKRVQREAQTRLGPGRCRDFLAGKVGNYADLDHTLQNLRPFDGARSTINMVAAGVAKDPYFASHPVNELFPSNFAVSAGHAPGTQYDVYLNTSHYNANVLIHESLHLATGLNDLQLATLLTGNTYRDRDVASDAIKNVLAANGCGWRP